MKYPQLYRVQVCNLRVNYIEKNETFTDKRLFTIFQNRNENISSVSDNVSIFRVGISLSTQLSIQKHVNTHSNGISNAPKMK